MFAYEFMRTAFAAAFLAAFVCGPVGWFLVLRGQSFASHALSHVGFAGAAAALLVGEPAFAGFGLSAVISGMGMGVASDRFVGRDVMIGLVLSLAMGTGALCLHFLTHSTGAATALLFGDILGIASSSLYWLAALAIGCLASLAMLSRPLLFASLQPEVAEANGVNLRLLDVLFLALVGIASAMCSQLTGVLLVFTLMVAPAAASLRLGFGPLQGMAVAFGLALFEAWGGLYLSWLTDCPASFWIALLGSVVFAVANGVAYLRGR
ncbi:metal ABC transporter permease [Acetobacter ghanensis]|uniref:High-affinity zinc uptake system membrane protein ZnuB n=1 Tax=Acetobacter ghanensis TaxID=431306 RepID=A0A0U5BHF3_9PROT|nr:metal ABC transporter permease [Acetobacter ghanensis]NHO39574.1 metal ABC transporter permease [Acetobacter ghanensis]GBQ46046.1 Mn2+/Zn2+ transporter permease [Acetobacter ghanensis DSM 18895]CEF54796.1 putative cation ABC transporter, permease protein [Acetobacter ghanensis]